MAATATAAAAPARGTDAFATAHARLLQDRSIQFDLPRMAPPQVPDWLRQLIDGLGVVAPLFRWLFWAAAIGGAGVLLFLLGRHLLGMARARRPATAAEPETWRPEAGPARELLREADELARRGEYAQAAHLLLWRSVEDIGARRPDLVPPAATSRDIARAGDLPTDARAAFARIARAVEVSLFGGRALDAGSWAECRSAYERVAFDGPGT
jgi:hypothetical protein